MDDDGVRAWESNLIKGSAIPGQNPADMNLLNQPRDERPVDVRIREKLGDLKETRFSNIFSNNFIHKIETRARWL